MLLMWKMVFNSSRLLKRDFLFNSSSLEPGMRAGYPPVLCEATCLLRSQQRMTIVITKAQSFRILVYFQNQKVLAGFLGKGISMFFSSCVPANGSLTSLHQGFPSSNQLKVQQSQGSAAPKDKPSNKEFEGEDVPSIIQELDIGLVSTASPLICGS